MTMLYAITAFMLAFSMIIEETAPDDIGPPPLPWGWTLRWVYVALIVGHIILSARSYMIGG
jgi:hypothetical protein